LGVILYQLLTGQQPFWRGDTKACLAEIEHREPKPSRQIDDSIPAELERITLRCLAKRAADRYATALDLVEDLRHWQASAVQPSAPAKVVPKGLRSFDAGDADFFLQLLPGPTDRDGLPESVRFWKTRIEQTDADMTFSVGLAYGPSGCGKSSLMKAGVLPRLAGHVLPVYVEATSDDTRTP
jgi:serine/threonine protein kinase